MSELDLIMEKIKAQFDAIDNQIAEINAKLRDAQNEG